MMYKFSKRRQKAWLKSTQQLQLNYIRFLELNETGDAICDIEFWTKAFNKLRFMQKYPRIDSRLHSRNEGCTVRTFDGNYYFSIKRFYLRNHK